MTTYLLRVRPKRPLKVAPTSEQAERWLEFIKQVWGIEPDGLTKVEPGFEVTVQLAKAPPDDDDIVPTVIDAFDAIGINEGTIEIEASEHEEDDEEFETPPWFEETVNLAEED